MGTLDEAIREHLELKRRQGAAEDELKQAEAEAFGPGEEDEVPGASITAPAGEGDQLDKVFSGETTPEPATTVMKPEAGGEPEAPGATVVEEAEEVVEADEGGAEVAAEETDLTEVEPAPEPQAAAAATTGPEIEEPTPAPSGDEADAGDLLEAERAHLTGHPTENYDVDAAIAEEQELDILSEGRLSEELDRALGEVDTSIPEGLGVELEEEPAAEVVEEAEVIEEVEVTEDVPEEPAPEQPTGDPLADEPGSASPLEDTPDFLEDSPASDELWFEQREPKDFDFGD